MGNRLVANALLLVSASVGITGISRASLIDAKTYPGTMCVEENDTTPEISYNFLRATNVAAGNNSFECPVIRDAQSDDINQWWVTLSRAGNTADSWTIFLHSCDEDGSSCNTDDIVVDSTDGVRTLNSTADIVSFENNGVINMETTIPDDCRIYSYYIEEWFGGYVPEDTDSKTFPGTYCVEQDDTTPDIQYNFLRSTNVAVGASNFLCPVVRDHVFDSPAVLDWSATVHRDGNTDPWTITLYTCNEDGSSCNSDSVDVPGTNGSQTVVGDVGTITAFEDFGAETIVTSTPPGARIYSYVVEEDEGEE